MEGAQMEEQPNRESEQDVLKMQELIDSLCQEVGAKAIRNSQLERKVEKLRQVVAEILDAVPEWTTDGYPYDRSRGALVLLSEPLGSVLSNARRNRLVNYKRKS
jgi:hypothetical protein